MATDWIKDNFTNIVIAAFYIMEIPTCAIVIWETFTGKSIIDVVYDFFTKK